MLETIVHAAIRKNNQQIYQLCIPWSTRTSGLKSYANSCNGFISTMGVKNHCLWRYLHIGNLTGIDSIFLSTSSLSLCFLCLPEDMCSQLSFPGASCHDSLVMMDSYPYQIISPWQQFLLWLHCSWLFITATEKVTHRSWYFRVDCCCEDPNHVCLGGGMWKTLGNWPRKLVGL